MNSCKNLKISMQLYVQYVSCVAQMGSVLQHGEHPMSQNAQKQIEFCYSNFEFVTDNMYSFFYIHNYHIPNTFSTVFCIDLLMVSS